MIDIVTNNVRQIGTPADEGRVYISEKAYKRIKTCLLYTSGEAREIYNVDTENVKDSGKTFLQVLGVRTVSYTHLGYGSALAVFIIIESMLVVFILRKIFSERKECKES